MYRMCRRCRTEDVQKVYRRCTEGMYRRICRRLNEKKAACALTGWLYGPQGMPRHRAQAARSLCLAGAVTSTLSCLCRGRTVRRGQPWVYLCTFCWKSLLKAFCTSANKRPSVHPLKAFCTLLKLAKGLLHILYILARSGARALQRLLSCPPARSKTLFRTCLAEYTSMTAQRIAPTLTSGRPFTPRPA